LKLFGMRAAYDEVMATGIERQHEPPRIVDFFTGPEVKIWSIEKIDEVLLEPV
jgi:hypothetical protein